MRKLTGGINWAVLATMAVLAVIGLIVGAASGSPDGEGSDGGVIGGGMCHTNCYGLVELECGSNKFMGGCFGVWDCSPPERGPHECVDSDGI